MRHLICIGVFAWQCLNAQASLACPANTTALRPTWCLRYYSTGLNFCDAFRTCRSNGERMVDRPVLDAIRNLGAAAGSLFDTSHTWWVGLTDALNERNSSKTGWVWISDGRVTTQADGEAYFEASEPNDLVSQDCVTTITGSAPHKLRDAGCNEMNKFYCYFDAVADAATETKTDQMRQFVKSPIATFSQPDPGCWIGRRLATFRNATNCASFCYEYGRFGDCLGFYWNSAREECIILPYFDAAVPLSYANEWELKEWRKYTIDNNSV